MGGKYPGADAILAVRNALQDLSAAHPSLTLPQIQEHAATVPRTKLRSVLSMMKDLGMVAEMRGSRYALKPNASSARVEDVAARYTARQDADRAKLERIALYAQSAGCRWKLLLEYFEEADDFERCGTCDNCIEPLEERLAPPVDRERSSPAR